MKEHNAVVIILSGYTFVAEETMLIACIRQPRGEKGFAGKHTRIIKQFSHITLKIGVF